jgi:fatty-acyl-CoA synthase
MIGYWENETETRKAIRDGWFYTGDIAQRDADGYFFIQGRMKDVIISGGENVYPAEIENILYNCPEISDAAVVGKPDDRWVEIPVAFVVRKPGSALTVSEILALLDCRIARYKHPREVRFLDELPRNAMGKVVKDRLRNMLMVPDLFDGNSR